MNKEFLTSEINKIKTYADKLIFDMNFNTSNLNAFINDRDYHVASYAREVKQYFSYDVKNYLKHNNEVFKNKLYKFLILFSNFIDAYKDLYLINSEINLLLKIYNYLKTFLKEEYPKIFENIKSNLTALNEKKEQFFKDNNNNTKNLDLYNLLNDSHESNYYEIYKKVDDNLLSRDMKSILDFKNNNDLEKFDYVSCKIYEQMNLAKSLKNEIYYLKQVCIEKSKTLIERAKKLNDRYNGKISLLYEKLTDFVKDLDPYCAKLFLDIFLRNNIIYFDNTNYEKCTDDTKNLLSWLYQLRRNLYQRNKKD